VAVPSDGILWDLTTNLEGLDDGATAWSPSGRATSADNNVSGLRDVPVAPLAGTDAITLRYGAGPGLVMTAGQSVSGATIPVDTSDDAGDRTDDDAGAEHAATLYSLLRTCALHDIDTFAYLTDLLRKLAAGWPDRQLDDLLPEAWAAAHAEPTLGN